MVNEKTFQVPNMTCNGCRSTVTGEIEQIPGVKYVEACVATKLVTVEWETPATWDQIAARLSSVNYPAVVE